MNINNIQLHVLRKSDFYVKNNPYNTAKTQEKEKLVEDSTDANRFEVADTIHTNLDNFFKQIL